MTLAACLLGYGEVGLWLADESKREMYREVVEVDLGVLPVYSRVGYT